MSDQWTREDVEAVAECLGDDAAQLREENEEDERADNMNRAASMLTWMLLTHSAYASGVQPSQAPGALQAVFLDLLQQVDVFIEQQGEADFYTGPARAMRALLTGRKPAEHLQLGLDKFLAECGVTGGALPAAAPVANGGWCANCGVTHEGPHPASGVQEVPHG